MKNILVPIDFSQTTKKVIDQAVLFAKTHQSHLWLIHIEAPDPEFVGFGAGPQTVRDHEAKVMREDHQKLQDLAKDVEAMGVEVTPLQMQGPTVETILEQVKKRQADMIIMGSHGHGALYNLLLGSVSEGVLKKTPCPLLIIPSA